MVDIENLEFSCFGNQNFQNAGVGSGVDFKIFPEDAETQCLHTSGEVLCKVGWGTFGNKILSPPEDYFNRLYSQTYISHIFSCMNYICNIVYFCFLAIAIYY